LLPVDPTVPRRPLRDRARQAGQVIGSAPAKCGPDSAVDRDAAQYAEGSRAICDCVFGQVGGRGAPRSRTCPCVVTEIAQATETVRAPECEQRVDPWTVRCRLT